MFGIFHVTGVSYKLSVFLFILHMYHADALENTIELGLIIEITARYGKQIS